MIFWPDEGIVAYRQAIFNGSSNFVRTALWMGKLIGESCLVSENVYHWQPFSILAGSLFVLFGHLFFLMLLPLCLETDFKHIHCDGMFAMVWAFQRFQRPSVTFCLFLGQSLPSSSNKNVWAIQDASETYHKQGKPAYRNNITLLGTDISPPKVCLKMIFLFQRRDMLLSWRVLPFISSAN